jgi:hypothetical protein
MKRFFLLSFVVSGFFLNAQSLGDSPYASFGIGDIKYDNTVDINAMGGISTAYVWDFNNAFNFKNPAANQNLELTSIKAEASNENDYYKSNYNSVNSTKHSTYLSNLSIAFPISKKVKFGVAYQPYSSKNYNVLIAQTYDDGTLKTDYFTGSGTLSLAQAAISYSPTTNFSAGLRINYYSGKLYDLEEITRTDTDLINGYQTANTIKGANFTLGLTYQKKLKNDKKLTLGATSTFGNTGKMKTYYTNSTYFYAPTITDQTIIEQKTSNDKNLFPMETSLGVGFGHETKWFASGQFDYKKGETVQFLGQPFAYENSYKIAFGGWYLPNYNNFRNYFSRIIYRFGAYYEKGNLNLNDHNINQFAITGGVTLPFEKSSMNRLSGIDLGIEIGKRGTVQNNLILQNFINIRVGVNFADRWFSKHYYD